MADKFPGVTYIKAPSKSSGSVNTGTGKPSPAPAANKTIGLSPRVAHPKSPPSHSPAAQVQPRPTSSKGPSGSPANGRQVRRPKSK